MAAAAGGGAGGSSASGTRKLKVAVIHPDLGIGKPPLSLSVSGFLLILVSSSRYPV